MRNCFFRGLFWDLVLLRLFDARVCLFRLFDGSMIGLDWIGPDFSGIFLPMEPMILVHASLAQLHRNEVGAFQFISELSNLPNITSFTQHVTFF